MPRGTLYAAKQIAGMFLIGLSSLTLVALIVLSGMGFRLLVPGLGFEAPIPLADFLKFVGMFLGLAADGDPDVGGAAVVEFHRRQCGGHRADHRGRRRGAIRLRAYYPTTLPIIVAGTFVENLSMINVPIDLPVKALAFGSLGGVLVAILAGWDMARRDVL